MIYFNGTTFTPHTYQAAFTDNGEPRTQYGEHRRYWENMVAHWGHLEALRIGPVTLTPEQQTRLDTLNGLTGINGLYTGDCADFVEHGIIRDDTDCPWLQPMIADYADATADYLERQAEAPLEATARQHAEQIARRKVVDDVIDTLPDSEVDTLTYLYPRWSGDGVALSANALVRHKGILYRTLQAHTTQADWTPDTASSLFTRYRDTLQAWSAPTGAHDAYNTGDRVTHNEQTWTSDIDGNVWAPGVSGWTPD